MLRNRIAVALLALLLVTGFAGEASAKSGRNPVCTVKVLSFGKTPDGHWTFTAQAWLTFNGKRTMVGGLGSTSDWKPSDAVIRGQAQGFGADSCIETLNGQFKPWPNNYKIEIRYIPLKEK